MRLSVWAATGTCRDPQTLNPTIPPSSPNPNLSLAAVGLGGPDGVSTCLVGSAFLFDP